MDGVGVWYRKHRFSIETRKYVHHIVASKYEWEHTFYQLYVAENQRQLHNQTIILAARSLFVHQKSVVFFLQVWRTPFLDFVIGHTFIQSAKCTDVPSCVNSFVCVLMAITYLLMIYTSIAQRINFLAANILISQ